MNHDDLRVGASNRLLNRRVKDSVARPIEARLAFQFNAEPYDWSHLLDDPANAMAAFAPGELNAAPIQLLVKWRDLFEAKGTDFGVISGLADHRQILGDQTLRHGIEMIRMEMRHDNRLDAVQRLVGAHGEVDQRIW